MAAIVVVGQFLLTDGNSHLFALAGGQFYTLKTDEFAGWTVTDTAAREGGIHLHDFYSVTVARVLDSTGNQ